MYLIDFGTAREVNEETLSAYRKSFYTPLEQRNGDGNQGPWTDIYALCVTMYQCITGRSVPMATDRMLGEKVKAPRELGFDIPKHVEDALLHGMELQFINRTASMRLLEQELFEGVTLTEEKTEEPIVEWEEEEELPLTQARKSDFTVVRNNIVHGMSDIEDNRPSIIMNDIKKEENTVMYAGKFFLSMCIGVVPVIGYVTAYLKFMDVVVLHPLVDIVLAVVPACIFMCIPIITMLLRHGKRYVEKIKRLFFDTYVEKEEVNMAFARMQIEWMDGVIRIDEIPNVDTNAYVYRRTKATSGIILTKNFFEQYYAQHVSTSTLLTDDMKLAWKNSQERMFKKCKKVSS